MKKSLIIGVRMNCNKNQEPWQAELRIYGRYLAKG